MAEFDTRRADGQLKLGQLTCDVFYGPPTQTLRFNLTKQPAEYGRAPRGVYTWDCAKAPGGNPKQPPFVVIPLNFSNAVLTANSSISRTQQQASARRLAQHGRFRDVQALERALERYVPPIAFKIDLSPFNSLFTKKNKVTIVAWPEYTDFFLRSRRSPNDVYLLSVPSGLRLQAIITGFCETPETFPEELVFEDEQKDVKAYPVPTVPQTEEDKWALYGIIYGGTFAYFLEIQHFVRDKAVRDARQRSAYGAKHKAKP